MPRRSKHPGVWLDPRKGKDGRFTYWAKGPVIERLHGRRILKVPLRTRSLVEQWARQQSHLDELRRAGLVPAVTFGEFLADYAADLEQADYAENTRVGYLCSAREAVRHMGAETPTTVTGRRHLYELRRGVTGTHGTKRTKWRRLGRFFQALREQGLAPQLTGDMVRDCFTPRRGPVQAKDRPRCLDTTEIAAMLDAADGHPLPRFLLLTGMRIRAALGLTWAMVNLDARQLELPATLTKTRRARYVNLRWRPTIEDWLHEVDRADELVFGGLGYDGARRLLTYHGTSEGEREQKDGPLRLAVPGLRWKDLRSTCASYLHSLPISATHLERARDMGHSLGTAERDYVDVVRGLPSGTDTLEAAMGLPGAESQGGGRVVRFA